MKEFIQKFQPLISEEAEIMLSFFKTEHFKKKQIIVEKGEISLL